MLQAIKSNNYGKDLSIILLFIDPQADHPLLVGAVVDWNLSNDLLLFIEEIHMKRVWKGGPWSRIPAPFSRESRIPHVFHQFPESRFSVPQKYIKKSNFYKS